jgi:hypothetical protein
MKIKECFLQSKQNRTERKERENFTKSREIYEVLRKTNICAINEIVFHSLHLHLKPLKTCGMRQWRVQSDVDYTTHHCSVFFSC